MPENVFDVVDAHHVAGRDALRVVARQQQVLLDRRGAGSARRVLLASRPRMRSESRTEETSGLTTTTARSAKYIAR